MQGLTQLALATLLVSWLLLSPTPSSRPACVLCLQARVTVVNFLKEKGLYRGIHDNPMRLGISSRSKDVIEPLLKPQWWVACGDMAARSVAAVRDGTLEIIPKVRQDDVPCCGGLWWTVLCCAVLSFAPGCH